MILSRSATSFELVHSSFDLITDRTSSRINNTNVISQSATYLIAEAQLNGVNGAVLLDPGSGLS
jgi:hypothetical protein